MAWSVGGLLFAWAGIPLLCAMFDINLPELLHPLMAFISLVEHKPEALLAVELQAGIAAAVFVLALRCVKRSQQAEKVSTARTS
jgi:hypothetical protein